MIVEMMISGFLFLFIIIAVMSSVRFGYEVFSDARARAARHYSGTSGAEQTGLIESAHSILQSKNSTFSFAQILFSIGTLAYSILFVIYDVVPALIGWFGIVASILYGLGNGIQLVKPNFKVLWMFGGLLIWLFEIVIGARARAD